MGMTLETRGKVPVQESTAKSHCKGGGKREGLEWQRTSVFIKIKKGEVKNHEQGCVA